MSPPANSNQQSPLFVTATRKLKHWEDVQPDGQPALFQLQRHEQVVRKPGLPPRWELGLDLYLYVHTAGNLDPDVIPSQLMNPLLDAVESSFVVDDPQGNRVTLGGLVYNCYIDGAVEIFEGNLGDQAVAILPITVLVPT